MSIKVTFPAGENSVTVRGLYQWDYGQTLEIEAVDLGSEIAEVHFACAGMDEAIVRPCTFSGNIGTVTIPDQCLEQSSAISAWVYLPSVTQGHTSKTIVLPITARVRPAKTRDIPAEVCDRYTELIAEVNEAVNALENGNITVAKAKDATNAGHAASAGNAATANYATLAGFLSTLPIENKEKKLTSSGLYNIQYERDNEIFACGLVLWEQGLPTYFSSYSKYYNSNSYSLNLRIDGDGKLRVFQEQSGNGTSKQIEYTDDCVFYTSKLGG